MIMHDKIIIITLIMMLIMKTITVTALAISFI